MSRTKKHRKENEMRKRNGLLIVHTGDGKGKTTAALGLALRACGDGMNVLILQFIKGNWDSGEMRTIEALGKVSGMGLGHIELRRFGRGFTRKEESEEKRLEHVKAAHEALDAARMAMDAGKWDLLILDEINYAVDFGLISEQEMLSLAEKRPENLHLVFTGRNARSSILTRADLVTEMHCVKHPYAKGIRAQRGIEF